MKPKELGLEKSTRPEKRTNLLFYLEAVFPPLDKVIQITEYKILSLRVLSAIPIIIQVFVTLFKTVKKNILLFPIFYIII